MSSLIPSPFSRLASAAVSGLVGTGAQTFAGRKTLNDGLTLPANVPLLLNGAGSGIGLMAENADLLDLITNTSTRVQLSSTEFVPAATNTYKLGRGGGTPRLWSEIWGTSHYTGANSYLSEVATGQPAMVSYSTYLGVNGVGGIVFPNGDGVTSLGSASQRFSGGYANHWHAKGADAGGSVGMSVITGKTISFNGENPASGIYSGLWTDATSKLYVLLNGGSAFHFNSSSDSSGPAFHSTGAGTYDSGTTSFPWKIDWAKTFVSVATANNEAFRATSGAFLDLSGGAGDTFLIRTAANQLFVGFGLGSGQGYYLASSTLTSAQNNTRDLGATATRWRDLFLAGLAYLGKIATGSLPAASGVEGALVYDSTAKKLKFSNGTAWETVTSA